MTENTGGVDKRDANSHELSGAFALNALTPTEAVDFEHAAGVSASLQAEAGELQETAALLGLAVTPVAPSARMKIDLMAQINATPQLPAVTPVSAPADRPTPLTQVPAGESSASSTSSQIEAKPMSSGSAAARAEARWFTRPSRVIVAIAAAVALFFGGGVVGSVVTRVSAPSTVDASAAALTDIMAATDAQRASAPIESGGIATLVWSNTLGLSAVLIDGLPELPAGKVYEAWYIDESGSVASAGTFATAEAGITWHVLDGSMAAGDAVGLTVEPTGGSEQPTTDPILVMQSS